MLHTVRHSPATVLPVLLVLVLVLLLWFVLFLSLLHRLCALDFDDCRAVVEEWLEVVRVAVGLEVPSHLRTAREGVEVWVFLTRRTSSDNTRQCPAVESNQAARANVESPVLLRCNQNKRRKRPSPHKPNNPSAARRKDTPQR